MEKLTKKIKTKEQLQKRLVDLEHMYFDKFHAKSVQAINNYLEHNPEGFDENHINRIEHLVDSICLHGAWIYDRIQGKIATTHNKDYQSSLTKKVRKALGFTF
jgi:hypothetical protein